TLSAFRDDLTSARLLLCAPGGDRGRRDEGREAARRALGRFGALDGPRWRRAATVRRAPAGARGGPGGGGGGRAPAAAGRRAGGRWGGSSCWGRGGRRGRGPCV